MNQPAAEKLILDTVASASEYWNGRLPEPPLSSVAVANRPEEMDMMEQAIEKELKKKYINEKELRSLISGWKLAVVDWADSLQ